MIPSRRDTILAYASAYRQLLEEFNDSYREGGVARDNAVAAFERHREQFENAVELMSSYVQQDKEIATIAMSLPRVGGAIINFCLHWDDRIRWSELALVAAKFLYDDARIMQNASDLGTAYTSARQFDRARELLEFALAKAIAVPDLEAEAAARGNMANMEIRREHPTDAIPHARRALEIYRGMHDRRVSDALNTLSVALRDAGDRDEALRVAQEALDTAGDDPRGQARALNSRGISLRKLGHPEEAEEVYIAALRLFQSAGDVNGEADVLANLSLLFETKDIARAEQFATEALALRLKHKLGNTAKLVTRLRRFRSDRTT